MVEADNQVHDDRAQHRQRDAVGLEYQEGQAQDQHIDAELHIARTPAEALLQIECEDIDTAKAGAMTNQHQQADPQQAATDHRRIDGVQRRDIDPARRQKSEERQQRRGDEGTQGEGPAHALDRQIVEGKVDHKEHATEAEPGDIFRQQRQAGGAAGEQHGLGVEGHPERHQ